MSYRGTLRLTDEEYTVLTCFLDRTEIGYPVDCGYSLQETLALLTSLTKKQVIVGRAPYRLTKLGKRLLESIPDHILNKDHDSTTRDID